MNADACVDCTVLRDREIRGNVVETGREGNHATDFRSACAAQEVWDFRWRKPVGREMAVGIGKHWINDAAP